MKKKVAVVAGGSSSEYVVSVKSAAQVFESIDSEKFTPYLIVINENDWYWENDHAVKVDKNDFSILVDGDKISFDVVFNIIHGTPGEDGKLQGYWDILGIPYTSPDLFSSSITFNKHFCKTYLKKYDIPMAKSLWLRSPADYSEDEIMDRLKLPLFVKPNNGGSSFGISKVRQRKDLIPAIEKAFTEDGQVIIEEFIGGDEITCGLVKLKGEFLVLPLCEVVSKNEFFDYEAKYTVGMADEIVPARIVESKAKKVREYSKIIYDALNCKGIVRVDFIVKDDTPYFLEINTIPGMSKESIVPKMVRHTGRTLKEFYTLILEETLSPEGF